MSILKSEILSAVNDNLRRKETNIDVQLRQSLGYISKQGNYLFATDSSQTITTISNSVNYPTDYKDVFSICLNDGNTDSKPLDKIEYAVYKTYIADNSTGLPIYFAEFNNCFLFYPLSTQTFTVKIDYVRFHPYSLDTILFDEKFRTAIEAVATYNVAKRFGITEALNLWAPVARDEVIQLYQYSKHKDLSCNYTD